jgi:hypothetical protein
VERGQTASLPVISRIGRRRWRRESLLIPGPLGLDRGLQSLENGIRQRRRRPRPDVPVARTLGMPPLRQIGALVVHHARAPPQRGLQTLSGHGIAESGFRRNEPADETGQAVAANST